MTTPIDADVDLPLPADRGEMRPSPWPVLAVISAGGVLGALGRYGLTAAMPHPPGVFAWATFTANVTGCLLIGVLMVLMSEVWVGRRLLRPFLGVGVLGGYTTFSTYTVDIHQAVTAGAARTALTYMAATMAAALVAAWAGSALTSWALRVRRRRRPRIKPRAGERR